MAFSKWKKMDLLELGLRLWMAYVLITNAGIGITTPLKDLGLPPHIFQIIQGMWDTGYMMHLVKATELIAGIALIFNFYTPVVLLALIPVVINIYGMHVFLFHAYVTQGLYMLLICGFLVYRRRERFLPLLARKS